MKGNLIMSTHPNVILMSVLTPDDLSRKTMRDICISEGTEYEEGTEIVIGDTEYCPLIMESDYDESLQISAKIGDLVFYDLITYGYGDTINWDKAEKLKMQLAQWSNLICSRFNCSYEIYLSANFW